VLPHQPSWNNLANLYTNSSRCTHGAAKTRNIRNVGIMYHMVLSHLQSLHTLECEENRRYFRRHLACIPMKNLRILKSSDLEVIEALSTTDPPVQLKELWLTSYWRDHSLPWYYFLARVTSLTHLSLQDLGRPLADGPPPLSFSPFKNYNISISMSLLLLVLQISF
jgi:hypothetical protein